MDIKTAFDGQTLTSDWGLSGGLLASDNGLKTAIVLSLFTDRRAEAGDALPDGTADRRGWWGDVAPPANAPSDMVWLSGSRLWLLAREKQTAETAKRARDYCQEALAWLERMGVVAGIDVETSWQAMGVLGITITVTKANAVSERFAWAWTAANNLATVWKDEA